MASIDSLVTDLQNWTNAGSAILTNAIAAECVNEAIRRMKRKHNWRYQTSSVQLVLPGGVGLQSGQSILPPDFTQELYVYTVDPAQSDPSKALIPIKKVLAGKQGWFEAQSPIANTDVIFPQVAAPSSLSVITAERGYYIWGGYLTIVPTPSASITVELDYVRTLPDLVAGLATPDQNGWTIDYPDAVRMGGLRQAYLFLQQWEVAAGYETAFQVAMTEAIARDNATAFAGPPMTRGK